MSRLTTNEIKTLMEAYQEVYSPKNLTEEDQNNLLMIEFYNALVEEGFIGGKIIDELYETEILENLSTRIAGAVTKYGPKIGSALQKLTGFGTGPGAGGKRRALTIGAGTATAIDPQKAANQVSGAVTGTASAINRGARAASGQAVPAAGQKKEYQYNSFDVFDAIKGHLIDEGYADTEEAAEAIMANMSEEWRQSILVEDPVQDYRDMKRSQENAAGTRGPELSHSSKGPKSPGSAPQRTKPQPRGREFTNPPS